MWRNPATGEVIKIKIGKKVAFRGQGVEALDIMASTPFCGSAFMIDIGMIPKAAGVRLTPEDRAALEARLRAPRTEQRRRFSRTDRFDGRGRALDALDCTHAQEYAANGQHLAGPICARGFGRLSGQASAWSKAEVWSPLERAPSAGFARRTGPFLAGEGGK
jgi:hypothetical protein